MNTCRNCHQFILELISQCINIQSFSICKWQNFIGKCISSLHLCFWSREISPVTQFTHAAKKCNCNGVFHIRQHFILIQSVVCNQHTVFFVLHCHKALLTVTAAWIFPLFAVAIISFYYLKSRVCKMCISCKSCRNYNTNSVVFCCVVNSCLYLQTLGGFLQSKFCFNCQLNHFITAADMAVIAFLERFLCNFQFLGCAFRYFYTLANMIFCTERSILCKSNFCRLILCCNCLTVCILYINVLVSDIACFFIISDMWINTTCFQVCKCIASVFMNFHADIFIFHCVAAGNQCLCIICLLCFCFL